MEEEILFDLTENANSNIITFGANYSFAKGDILYLNAQMILSDTRAMNSALIRFTNHYINDATQYFIIINSDTNAVSIGYSDPIIKWLCTASQLPAGNYRIIGTLKMN